MNEALDRAIKHFGGQAQLARAVGVKRAAVWVWVRQMHRVPVDKAVAIERATAGAIRRDELRPDVFGPISALPPA